MVAVAAITVALQKNVDVPFLRFNLNSRPFCFYLFSPSLILRQLILRSDFQQRSTRVIWPTGRAAMESVGSNTERIVLLMLNTNVSEKKTGTKRTKHLNVF